MRFTLQFLAGALVFTALFFYEYTGLHKKVHIPFDLEGFHYSLVDAAFIMLRAGHLPLWDFSTYCGIPLAGNIQAALFYPVTWLMFLANAGKAKLPYSTVEYAQLGHLWLGFCLCFFWLHRGRGASRFASLLGAAAFAFGGYATGQITHWGLIGCYIWFPLAFWAIDRWNEKPGFRPVAMLAMASAFALLAGYAPSWACFCVCVTAYAAASRRTWRSLAAALAAIALCCGLAAVQLAPTAEASQFKTFDPKYGDFTAIRAWENYSPFLTPNYYDFELGVDVGAHPGRNCLYLGSAAIAGLLLFFVFASRREWGAALPAIGSLLAAAAFLTNPFGVLGTLMGKSKVLTQIFSDWYFFAGIMASLPLLIALGIDAIARGNVTIRVASAARIAFWIVTPVALAWHVYLFSNWLQRHLAVGPDSVRDGIWGVALFVAMFWIWRNSDGRRKFAAAAAVLLMAAVDHKVYGTSKRLNSYAGTTLIQIPNGLLGIRADVFAQLRAHPTYRIALEETGPDSGDMRHARLATPQGFDPFMPEAYSKLVESHGAKFRSSRHFSLPVEKATLELFGIRYIAVSDHTSFRKQAAQAMAWLTELEPVGDYRVFEYKDAKPAYAFPQGPVEVTAWEPAHRAFRINAENTGTFRLSEQYYPGWTARIDGAEVPIERCHMAFQCVPVTAGTHVLDFDYRPRSLMLGAAISLLCILGTLIGIRLSKP